jgi:hypothetical protein
MANPDLLIAQPNVIQVSPDDISVVLGMDLSANVGSGQSVSSPVSTLTNLETGIGVTLTDAPTVVGNVVNQRFRPASQMQAGSSYRWIVVYTLDANNTLACSVQINCGL